MKDGGRGGWLQVGGGGGRWGGRDDERREAVLCIDGYRSRCSSRSSGCVVGCRALPSFCPVAREYNAKTIENSV